MHIMHSKGDNKEIKTNDKTDKAIEKLFKSPLNRYQNNLKTFMRGSNFIFDFVCLLYYKCQQTSQSW